MVRLRTARVKATRWRSPFESVSLARSRVRYPSPSCSSLWMGSAISLVMESHIGRISGGSHGATPGSHLRSSSSDRAVTWARLRPSMVDARAFSDSRVPWQSGHTDSHRNFATRAMPFSSFAFASAFLTVFTAL